MESIHYHINGTKLRDFLQVKHMSWKKDIVWESVNIHGLGMPYKKLPISKRHKVCKMLHGWLNSGKQRVTIHMDALSQCPRCSEPMETQEHILQCRDPRAKGAQYKGLVTLKSTIVTKHTDTHTWKVLFKGLSIWLQKGTNPGAREIAANTANADLAQLLEKAIEEQAAIGWHLGIRGYLSHTWTKAQAHETRVTTEQINQGWYRTLQLELWKFIDTMWEHRNAVLHSKEELAKDIRES
jgi:hypothetical protein